MRHSFRKIKGKSTSYGNMKCRKIETMFSCNLCPISALIMKSVSCGVFLAFINYISSDGIRGKAAYSEYYTTGHAAPVKSQYTFFVGSRASETSKCYNRL